MGKEKAIIYKRVSTNEQALEGYSLANQEKELRDYCDKNEIEVVEVYEDELSGSEMENRVGLRSAINHLLYSEDNIKYLMVWKLSRLSRKIIDVLEIVELLQDNKKVLISHKDIIDTSRPQDKYLLHFTAIFAEFERDTLITQVIGGMEQKARQGEWNGGKPPLGYDLLKKKLVINEEEIKIVKEIYNRYLMGEGYLTIANELNKKGYKTSMDKDFSSFGVKFILTNPTYKGWVRWGYRKDWGKMHKNPKTGTKHRKRKYNEEPIYVEGKHEAIISEEIFDEIQDRIENNPRRHMKRFQGFNLLSGILRCPNCGYGMSISKKTSKGKDYYYYVCNQYQNKKMCSAEGIRQEQIEEEFFRYLDRIINSDDFQAQLTEISVDKDIRIKGVEEDINRLEQNIKKLEREEERLLEELIYLKKDRHKEIIRVKLDEVSEEVESLLKLIGRKKRGLIEIESEVLNVEEIIGVLKNAGKVIKVLDDKETKQSLVRKLIREIRVRDKHIVEIEFNYGESLSIDRDGIVVGLESEGGTLSQIRS